MMKNLRFVVAAILATTMLMVSQSAFSEQEEWEFLISPMYIWAKSIDGVSAIGGSETALDLDFQDDILENIDSSFTIHFEATRDNMSWFGEVNYGRLGPNSTRTLGGIEINADVDYVDLMAEAGFFRQLGISGTSNWEILAAVRYYDQDIDVRIATDPGNADDPPPENVMGGDSWWNAVVGLRCRFQLAGHWHLSLRSDFGYGGSKNQSLHLAGIADYPFNDWGSFFLGYRFLAIDYDNKKQSASGYRFDADQQGPVLGLNIHF